MRNYKRIIVATLSAILLSVGFTAPAAADTFACNASYGVKCGKVANYETSAAAISIIDHDGLSRNLPPGYNSRGSVYMRDVARVVIPTRYCARWHLSGTGGTWYWKTTGAGGYALSDREEWVRIHVRPAGTC